MGSMSSCRKYPPPDLTLYEEILRVERLTEQQLPLEDICRVVGQIQLWVVYTIRFRRHLPEEAFDAIKRGHMNRAVASVFVSICCEKDNMRKKEILHQILLGMDAYLSCGVPDSFWGLVRTLTLEVYGKAGVELLEKFHETDDDARDEIILHTVHGWDDPNNEVNPPELIDKLEALK